MGNIKTLGQLPPQFTIFHPDAGNMETRTIRDNTIYIPRGSFKIGTVVSRELPVTPGCGNISLDLNNNYYNADARNVWIYRVSVNGHVRARWDGSLPDASVKITIRNVCPRSKIALEAVVLSSRLGIKSWTDASRASIDNLAFEEAAPSEASTTVEVNASEVNVTPGFREGTISVDISDIAIFPKSQLVKGALQRIDVITDQGALPFKIKHMPESKNLTIFSNGAVDLDRSGGEPVFQRSTWTDEISSQQIFVCDPGTVGPNALSLSWGQLSQEYWAIPEISVAIRSLSAIMGVNYGANRIYFGSSAGGFMSMCLAALDAQSHAIVNNAQFDWTRWMPEAVNKLRSARFRNLLPADIRRNYPQRSNALNLIKAVGDRCTVTYYVNVSSPHDANIDLKELENFIDAWEAGRKIFKINRYRDPATLHNPMSKPKIVKIINNGHLI